MSGILSFRLFSFAQDVHFGARSGLEAPPKRAQECARHTNLGRLRER